tara:strand:+ start:12081 stop:13334 length:1254 start_codon:yes stop_codon:yes gene_type:complete
MEKIVSKMLCPRIQIKLSSYFSRTTIFLLTIILISSSCTNKENNSKSNLKYATKIDSRKVIYTHQYSRKYSVIYPSSNNLYYYKLKVIKDSINIDSVSVQISFKNTYSNFKNYAFKLNELYKSTSEDTFTFKFDKNAKDYIYKNLKIDVITTNNKSFEYFINISFDPKILHLKNGRTTSNNGFHIHETDVSYMEILSTKFIVPSPTDDEKLIILTEFGDSINNIKSEKEKINTLAKIILNTIDKNRGIPSDTMNQLSSMEQYYRVKNNLDKFWCGNIAYLFTQVCSSFNIPSRIIGLGNTYSSNSETTIYNANHHTLTEIYNKDSESWEVIDLTFNMLRATNKKGKTLNFIDFWSLINISQERNGLIINYYDTNKNVVEKNSISQSKNRNELLNYYKKDQKACFPYSTKNGSGYYNY